MNYVSRNLCDMVGVDEHELLCENEDRYISFVHPSDCEAYSEFLQNLKNKEQTLTCEYHLIKKDGSTLYVSDTITSQKLDNGTLVGYSVLTDVTDIKNENNNLQFLNETIPCGFIKYTCEKQPKVTYINQQMMDFLRF
ncbi:MAG: PAS domain-containing protein, partial [Clostridia bacterium]|nr:PAS domain-containing protein [Clostridia bacterium]